MSDMSDLSEKRPYERELSVASALARQAGELILSRWDTPFEVSLKGAVDLVSELDLAAERLINAGLNEAFPEDVVCGEEGSAPLLEGVSEREASARLVEHANTQSTQGRVWYVDPLDGTTNFTHGFPHFCVSIALFDRGAPVVGVIYEPTRSWLFWAVKGQGAWRDERPLKVSECEALSGALIATGFPYDRHESEEDNTREHRAALKRAQGMRRAGAAALDLAFVAAGWLDAYWERKLKPWDVAAGALIAQEAGATLTGFDQPETWLAEGAIICAATPTLHTALSEVIK
jgi:myo-inositol-1(or 4)-monophosphatase